MLNQEERKLVLSRGEICDIMRALTSVKRNFLYELQDENTTNERRKTAERSLDMWESLHTKVKEQLHEQDLEEENENCKEK